MKRSIRPISQIPAQAQSIRNPCDDFTGAEAAVCNIYVRILAFKGIAF